MSSNEMSQERWGRVQRIFDAALEVGRSDREAFVRSEAGGDARLFEEVMSLLRADSEGASILDGDVFDVIPEEDQVSYEGLQVGNYQIVKPIATGGMGVVCLAERTDGTFKQRVAIKLVKRGMDSDEILRRFRNERAILARLEHPNIARLLDGGLSSTNQPYFAMEYVDGLPIDEYCDRHELSIRERLNLYLTVCDAVEYAHANLVVHRDLKPANILVTESGNVKLLDFGISKVLGHESDLPTDLTATGHRVLTPSYASPEQVRGESVTTRSDIYSLGVVLYELLSGNRPFEGSGKSLAELERSILTTQPQKPSSVVDRSSRKKENEPDGGSDLSRRRATTLPRLKRSLAGDLDTICLTALQKDSSRRYQSVDVLAGDVRRHLAGRVIAARRDSFLYSVGKFMGRHRVIVTTAASAVLLLAIFTTYYTRQLAAERDRARTEAAKAAAVSDFLTDVFVLSDPYERPGTEITARELLDNGSKRIETELAAQPEVGATMYAVLGRVYYNLGLYEDSERLWKRSLELRRQLFGDDHLDVARCLAELGVLHDERGDLEQAEALSHEALKVLGSVTPIDDTLAATVKNDLAMILRHGGNFDSAEVYYTQALKERRELLGPGHPDVAHSVNHLARLKQHTGRLTEATALYREALRLRREYYATDYHFDVGASMAGLAATLMESGEVQEAESLYAHAYDIMSTVGGEDHPYASATLTSWARASTEAGKIDQALRLYQQSLATHRKNLPPGHINLAQVLHGYGLFLNEHGDYHESEPLLRECLSIRRSHLPEGHWITEATASALADCLRRSGQYEEAAALAMEAYTNLLVTFGESDRRTQDARRRAEAVYRDWDRPFPSGQLRYFRSVAPGH